MNNDILFNINVTDIVAANRLTKSPIGVASARYNRDKWGIMLKTKGKTVYTCNGQEILSDSTHPVILPKGCTYTWKCYEPGECIAIEFDSEVTDDMIYSFSVSDNSFLLKGFSKIEKNLTIKNDGYRIENLSIIYSLLFSLCKTKSKEYTPSTKQKLLKPALTYIAEHYYDSTITNEFLASLCSISTVYFRKTFESVYGISVGKFIRTLRIEKAKALLKGDYESVAQVAESVGYSSIYHFSKMFKQITGLTPSEYSKLK